MRGTKRGSRLNTLKQQKRCCSSANRCPQTQCRYIGPSFHQAGPQLLYSQTVTDLEITM